MNGSAKIQPTHRQRQAVVYLRQSTPRQVAKNRESAINQRALRDRLLELGWKKDQIAVVDEDQGRSAKLAAGREGFQGLVADVSLRKVGLIMGIEVSRLSRNCADWHRLLELCALFDTLIADADGVYNTRDFNDRLLLGLKGTLSEAELHSIRLRLDAGRLSKAGRGELVQHLPTGLVRGSDGVVRFDPDRSVKDRIRLVFAKFQELGSAQKVLRYLATQALKLPRKQTSGLQAGAVLWKEPSQGAVLSVLKNPAYAGAFAYGQRIADPTRQVPGQPSSGRIRKPREYWQVLVPDVYPAYISWGEYERNQVVITENGRQMAERMSRERAGRSSAALLTGLAGCGVCGCAMRVSYKHGSFQYVCHNSQSKYAKTSCQHISGLSIDDAVVREFFGVLRPAEIDALEGVNAKQAEHRRELVHHLEQEVRRLEFATSRAERQYDSVDPENRLIAATLEKRWEDALAELERSKARLAEVRFQGPPPVAIPVELRAAFADVGRRLPELWGRLPTEVQRSLLRTLVTRVNLTRDENGIVRTRIVWQGGLVGEKKVRVPMRSFRSTDRELHIITRILRAADEGQSDAAIAAALNEEGFHPSRGAAFTSMIVLKLRSRHGIRLRLGRVRCGDLPGGYTVREMAKLTGIDPSWFYHAIGDGKIEISKDERHGCYLFPRTKAAVTSLKQLKCGKVPHVSFRKGHCNG